MNKIVAIVVFVLLIGSLAGYSIFQGGKDADQYNQFAQCLADNQAIMFGASWCPACSQQKALFKRGAKTIPYYECSPEGKGSPQDIECTNRGVSSYPTWQFDESYLASLPDETWVSQAQAYDAVNPDSTEELTNFEKLKALDINGVKPYNDGRFGGVRSLEELALYAGCEDALPASS